MDSDESSGRSSSRRKKPPAAKSTSLPSEAANGTVAEVFPNQCSVRMDDDGRRLLCKYRRAEVIQKGAAVRERSPVAVGDRVRVEPVGNRDGIVTGICERRNRLVRPAPDRDESLVHVLVANIDVLVIVAASRDPEFSPGVVDRFLVAAAVQGITPIVCVNKIDLADPAAPKAWEAYRDAGYQVVEASARRGDGVKELREALGDRMSAFCGHSGVGKTSLLRALVGEEIGKIGEVSQVTGKGRHTTTGAVLLEGERGSRWIDTPGVREFGLIGVEPDELASHYPELVRLGCAARGCLHVGEEGCEAGDLPRLASYRRIRESLLAGER